MATGKNVSSRWSATGNLVFRDRAGNIIFTIDGVNRKMTFPTTGILDLAGGEVGLADIATGLIDVYLADGQDETMTAAITVTGVVATDEVAGCIVFTTKASIATMVKRAKTDFTTGAGTITVGANAANNTNNQYLFIIIHHA